VEIKLVWILVLPWQAVIQHLEAMPANAPLDLLDGFSSRIRMRRALQYSG
jgi:hypothetical protein